MELASIFSRKNISRFLFISGLLLVVLCSACTPSSIHPLSNKKQSFVDKTLIGSWELKAEKDSLVLNFKPSPQPGKLVVEFVETKPRPGGKPDKVDTKLFDLFSTKIKGKTIATVKAPPESGSKEPYKSARYSFAWYVIEQDRKLYIRFLSNEEAAGAVKVGKIKGKVTKLEFGGHDVILTDSTSNLNRWVREGDIEKLFSDSVSLEMIKKAGPFLRVSP